MVFPTNRAPNPGIPHRTPPDVTDLVGQGLVVKTNRENQGSWSGYLDALRRQPTVGGAKAEYQRPGDRTPARGRGARPVRASNSLGGAKSSVSPAGQNKTAGAYGAGQEMPAGQNTANYAAGLRRYGASGRSAPNVGPVRNKAGYNERDRKAARANGANLAIGDEMSRVRLLGG